LSSFSIFQPLDDAVKAARIVVGEKSHLETEEEKDALAELIGVNSVKFTELSHPRRSDYVFDLDKMVALEGDTAPYLLYSYVRARSIFRKLEQAEIDSLNPDNVKLTEPAEIHIARMLARYSDSVKLVLDDYRPNLLCTYLLELARCWSWLGPIIPSLKPVQSSNPRVRSERLVLSCVTSPPECSRMDSTFSGLTFPSGCRGFPQEWKSSSSSKSAPEC